MKEQEIVPSPEVEAAIALQAENAAANAPYDDTYNDGPPPEATKSVPEIPVWYRLMNAIGHMSSHLRKDGKHKVRAGFTKNKAKPRNRVRSQMAKRSRVINRRS